MSTKGALTSEERLEIVEVLKKGNLSHREIAKRFNRSQSTISSIARDAGITPTHRRRRTPAARAVDSTYDKERRVDFEDRFLGVLDGMLNSGGLTPREAREVAQAAKVVLDARRSEDVEPGTSSAEPDEERYVPIGLGAIQVPEEWLEQQQGHPGEAEEYGSSSFSAGDKATNGGF